LPYGTTACKWDTIIPFEPLWGQYQRIIKDNGVIVLTASQPFTSALVMSNISWFKYSWVWIKNKKTGFLNAKKQPLRQVEDVTVFYRKQPTYNPQKTHGHKPVNSFTKHTSDGQTVGKTKIGISGGGQTDRFPSNVLYVPVVNNDNSNGDKFHPTQKPVALFEYLIKTYTNEGDTVLDNCMGSGTTGIACKNLNRNFVGIELDPEYFKIAEKRINENL
jgi:site-specific DNA-methyltransferase (adenine-specific)